MTKGSQGPGSRITIRGCSRGALSFPDNTAATPPVSLQQENNDDLNEEDMFPVTEVRTCLRHFFVAKPTDNVMFFFQRYSGLREQDLREAKDLLLVETSDMLHIPLFTAEALLKNHGKQSNSDPQSTLDRSPSRFQSGLGNRYWNHGCAILWHVARNAESSLHCH